MRCIPAGLLILALASSSFAQVRGEVESIGLDGYFRPDCWTPMVVRLDSQISDPAEYRIEVHQRDLDFDHVIYVKEGITLNPHATQRWELCFLPQPTNGGLPENGASLASLQEKLRVYLTNKAGTKQLMQLPVTSTLTSLDPQASQGGDESRGKKLILCIAEGSSRPAFSDYQRALGVVESPVFVRTSPRNLPQSVLAYQAVDAVLWVSGKAQVLTEEGSRQLSALQQWVRQGGSLVVCQPSSDGERQDIEALADMLPIVWKENGEWKVHIEDKDDLEPLKTLAALHHPAPNRKYWDIKGKFPFARAVAKPNAVVDQEIEWPGDKHETSPYVARIPYGLGCVTWVAQDLGNPALTGPKSSGWPYVWDKVFGWANDTRIVATRSAEGGAGDVTEAEAKAYEVSGFGTNNGSIDLGSAQLHGVDFGTKGAGLIILALLFFIAYWLVAGPGVYLFLAGRKRKELSWLGFAFSALAATALTVLVVRLVLRGSAEVRHASDVRMVSGQEQQPAIVYSRIGLYIPRDGDQHVALDNTSSQLVSFLTPMTIYPAYVTDNEFPANLDYRVPVRDEPTADPVAIDVPFRSTLKKLQAKWCGDIPKGIRGNAVKLNPGALPKNGLQGSLDNLTGVDLKNIYVAFHDSGGSDYILYVPKWPATGADSRIDLAKRYSAAIALPLLGQDASAQPEEGKDWRGDIGFQWALYWHISLSAVGEKLDDLHADVPFSFPIISFFDRIPPSKTQDGKPKPTKAAVLLRRGARNLNMSSALMAGELVVLAQADNRPLPFPLEVNGYNVGGEGTVFYQFALPLDHGDSR